MVNSHTAPIRDANADPFESVAPSGLIKLDMRITVKKMAQMPVMIMRAPTWRKSAIWRMDPTVGLAVVEGIVTVGNWIGCCG